MENQSSQACKTLIIKKPHYKLPTQRPYDEHYVALPTHSVK